MQVAAPYDPAPCRSAEDRPHRGGGERYYDHNHHHGDEGFVIGEKLLHDRKSPSPGSHQSKLASASTDTRTDRMEAPATTCTPQTTANQYTEPNRRLNPLTAQDVEPPHAAPREPVAPPDPLVWRVQTRRA
ncbi:hypothetical protein ROP_pROB02-02350 (plasmid) [Rhodococcus opacus B4]|uniref:Uncharacterized protein n=1 Tax=Rhodococcus opacus (strain B4) TaxID=632772 RepID=C1BE39_RHOOB|nr:hypothetical protein ROP_pROB02-02350 [Rhodococcus opacus B4]